MEARFETTFLAFPTRLTFDVEIHGLADISPNIIADSTQVEATVFFQHMFDEQGAIDKDFDSKPRVESNGFKLGDPSTCKRTQNNC